MKFNALSEDRLALAMKLAQRDMKKKREEESISKSRPRSRSPSPKGAKSRYIPGKDYWDKMQRRSRDPKREKRILMVKEHDRNRQPKNEKTQTPPRIPRFAGGRVPDPTFPVSSQSPPSRDTDFKIYPIKKSAPTDQPDKEIERLQREMESYLQQIQVIEQRVISEQNTDFLQPMKAHKKGYLPEEEREERRKARSEEQQTRAARQLYVLRQQVREIQNQVTRTAPNKMKHTKKSAAVAKLAAAHRGAVRAIQSFVNNLPHSDLRKGLPSTYHELALLVRQMSLLSTQLSMDGESAAHEDLIKMLDRVDELNKAWCTEVQETSFDVVRAESEGQGRRRKSPVARQPFAGVKPVKQKRPAFVSYRGKENKPLRGTCSLHINFIMSKIMSVYSRDITPDRKETLRAGIAALLDTSDVKSGEAGMAWSIPMSQSHPPANKKSLIIPAKLQAKRERAQRAVPPKPTDHHFADPTISSTIKAVEPIHYGTALERSFSAPPSPGRDPSPDGYVREPWRPGGRSPGKTPTSAARRVRSQSPLGSRRQYMAQDFDGSIVSGPSSSDRLVNEAELAIRMRLKPLLEKADALASRQERLMFAKESSARDKLADRASEAIEMNGDVLSDMILEDVLTDTVKEMERVQLENRAHREAISMQDNPTLETMFQRLEQMEQEQFEIRRRWATLEFEEESSNLRSKRSRDTYSRPQPPVAMEIKRNDVPGQRLQKNLDFDMGPQDDPIIFTKRKSAPKFHERRFPQDEGNEYARTLGSHKPLVDISLPKNVVDNVHSHLEKYERYLRKSSHESLGKFNPWKLVEEVSDQILDECLREVSEEVEDLNEAIVNNVCKSEFMINSSINSTQSSPKHSPSYMHNGAKFTLPSDQDIAAHSQIDDQYLPSAHGTEIPSASGAKIVAFSEQPVQLEMSGERDDSETMVTYDDEFEEDDDDDDEDETEDEEEDEEDEEH
ncbi:hypothetical protein FSP39_010828 [Pinctada imbricata]|uniref:Uncharacterized protein n=1 Tax=Pinctada imbricata TaxID=66713 RepID=A0AA88XJW4_PINIB|nr:hypothetical protein FSP39_010828 [Pinctada imbricata]